MEISSAQRQLNRAGMLRVVVDLNVTSVGIFRGLLRHDPAGTIVFLPENRIHCGYNRTKPAAFHHFSGDEQARIEIAFYDFPRFNQLGFAERIAVSQPPEIRPKRHRASLRLGYSCRFCV